MQLIPVILSGGAGTRLWPVSREQHPKPFIRLADGQSLLQKSFLRAKGLPDVVEVLTVTNRDLFFKTADEYRETGDIPMPLFYLSGIMAWTYFAETMVKTSNVFRDNSAIFSKVYFPRLIMPLSIISSNLIKLFIQLLFLF